MHSGYERLRLVSGCPHIFLPEELDLYEKTILADPDATERDAARFFAQYPQFLFLGQGIQLRREVTLYRDGVAASRVDFFRKRLGTAYWDVVEIKSPKSPLVVATHGQHPRLSAEVFKAISQAQDYRRSLDEDVALRKKLLDSGIRIFRPHLLIVVGKDNNAVDPDTMRDLFDRVSGTRLEIRSYSQLYAFARDCYESCRVIILTGCLGSIGMRAVTEVAVRCPGCGAHAYHYYRSARGKGDYWLCSNCDLLDDSAEHYPLPGRCPK